MPTSVRLAYSNESKPITGNYPGPRTCERCMYATSQKIRCIVPSPRVRCSIRLDRHTGLDYTGPPAIEARNLCSGPASAWYETLTLDPGRRDMRRHLDRLRRASLCHL